MSCTECYTVQIPETENDKLSSHITVAPIILHIGINASYMLQVGLWGLAKIPVLFYARCVKWCVTKLCLA